MFKYKFQHYVDIQTSASSLTMIQIQAGGEYAMQRMKHLWGAFKYVKMGRISAKFLPASTLPVDPLGLSYGDTDPQTVDPRDQMNPGLVRITNGEDILTDFTGISAEVQDQMYINTMLDPRWSKFMLQRGFSRSAVPLYWNVGELHQDVYPGSVVNLPAIASNGVRVDNTSSVEHIDGHPEATDIHSEQYSQAFWNRSNSDARGLFQTGHKGRMSWMPTDAFEYFHNPSGTNLHVPLVQPLPAINVITCLLPRAHKTIYYYRLFITETYYFSGIKNTGIAFGDENREIRAVDNFMQVQMPFPINPDNQAYPMFGGGSNGAPFGLPAEKNDGDSNW